MKRLLFSLLIWGFLIQNGTGQNHANEKTIANQIIQIALEEQQAHRWLSDLCKKIGPRLSGSQAAINAAYWAAQKLQQIGADTVWLQPVVVPHWVRGATEKLIVHFQNGETQSLTISTLGGSVGTPPEGLSAPVVQVPDFSTLNSLGDAVKGKIVFFDFPMDAKKVNTFRAYGEAVQYRVFGAQRAAQLGAVGVLIRSITTRHDDVPHTGVMLYNDSIPPIPAAALSWRAADQLTNWLKQQPHLRLTLRLSARTLPDTINYNVIAEIHGKERPEEIIVVGGHLDSWDVGCGAHDDGAGIVQAMEVLSFFKRLNIVPKRTIRCVLFINEENGSKGARTYADFATQEKARHYAAIESDRGGFTPRGFSVSADSILIHHMQQWLPILQLARIEWIRPGGSGADISRLKNCPLKIGYVPDDQRYFDFHHSANDVLEGVHPRELALGSAAIGILTYLLSETHLYEPNPMPSATH